MNLLEKKIIEHIPLNEPSKDLIDLSWYLSFFINDGTKFMFNLIGKKNDEIFKDYLAGVVDGRGLIVIPGEIRTIHGITYPSIQFNRDVEEEPYLRTLQRIVGLGTISRGEKGSFRWTINSVKEVRQFIELINGRLRTTKINDFNRLIEWQNYDITVSNNQRETDYRIAMIFHRQSKDYLTRPAPERRELTDLIPILPRNQSDLSSNAWLSGYLDVRSTFSIRADQPPLAPRVDCTFELTTAQEASDGSDKLEYLQELATFFQCNIRAQYRTEQTGRSRYPEYRFTTASAGNQAIVKYLDKYPLFSSKYLEYQSWLEIYNLKVIKKQSNKDLLPRATELKKSLNTNRSIYSWEHLKYIHLKSKR